MSQRKCCLINCKCCLSFIKKNYNQSIIPLANHFNHFVYMYVVESSPLFVTLIFVLQLFVPLIFVPVILKLQIFVPPWHFCTYTCVKKSPSLLFLFPSFIVPWLSCTYTWESPTLFVLLLYSTILFCYHLFALTLFGGSPCPSNTICNGY